MKIRYRTLAPFSLHGIGRLLVLIGVIGATSLALADGKPRSRTFDTLVSSAPTGEPQLAVNPKDPNNLVYAPFSLVVGPPFNYNAPADIWYSHNGGKTWTDSGVRSVGDPAVAVDSDGTFYIGGDIAGVLPPTEVIGVRHSTDGGSTWSTPVVFTTAEFADRFWLATDLSTGTVYFSYHTASGRYVVASHDHGKTWGPPYTIDSGAYPNCCSGIGTGAGWTGLISAADGLLATAYFAGSAPGASCPCVVLETSRNDGKDWERRVALQNVQGIPSGNGYPAQVNAEDVGFLIWQPYFAADPSHPGRYAFLLLTNAPPTGGGGAKMSVYVTNDWGATWRHSTVTPKNAVITKPWLAYSPNGVLGMLWLTEYADGSFDAWAAVSLSGGPKFHSPVRLNSVTSPPDNGALFNDNSTVVLNDHTLFAAWGDFRPQGHLTSWFGRYDYRREDGDEHEADDE